MKFALSDTESFTLPSVGVFSYIYAILYTFVQAMLVSLIKKSTQWVLVAEDFAEVSMQLYILVLLTHSR